jgi:hypothetical protein
MATSEFLHFNQAAEERTYTALIFLLPLVAIASSFSERSMSMKIRILMAMAEYRRGDMMRPLSKILQAPKSKTLDKK